jgi:hypothetical protein
MRVRANLGWVGAAVVVLGLGSTALAQSGTGAPLPQVGFERHVQLSPQEQLAQADLIQSRVEQASALVRRQLDSARQARDVVKSLCLSDKLSQVDVAGRSAKDREGALQSAVQRGDGELANHEFTILTVLRQRVDQLSAEANQCVGEEVAFVGETRVVTEIDPNLPGTGEENTAFPAVAPAVATPVSPPPPVASPSM